MPRHLGTFRLLLLVFGSMSLVTATTVSQSATSQIERIEISPAWAGSASTTEAVVTISNRHGIFERTWNPSTITPEFNSLRIIVDAPPDIPGEETRKAALSRDTIAERDVLDIVRALTAPPLTAPSLSNPGIDQLWLEEQAPSFAQQFGNLGESNDERQQAFLMKSFTDLALIGKTVPRVVRSSWTDDPVWVHVAVRFANGKTIRAETRNQPPFMLPWTCETNGKKTSTFNADISRSIAKVLPTGTVNKERLQGADLMRAIVFEMDGSVTQRWKQIGAEDRAGEVLERLREKYTIRRYEVSEHIGLQYGSSPPEPGGENLQAEVRLPGFPKNLVVATVFPLHDGQGIGVDAFLHDGSQYERLVLGNPWIMDSLKRNEGLGAWLIYVQDASMSEKAMKIFAADMHELGRDDLAQEVSDHRTEIADLSYYGNEVLLFPDHHAILWRWDPIRDLFGWSASRVKTQRCTDYPSLNVGCSAGVVDADGQLEK
jgi:hypothetical protein